MFTTALNVNPLVQAYGPVDWDINEDYMLNNEGKDF